MAVNVKMSHVDQPLRKVIWRVALAADTSGVSVYLIMLLGHLSKPPVLMECAFGVPS